MVNVTKLTSAVAAAGLFASAVAHPGEHHDAAEMKHHIAVRNARAAASKRALDACQTKASHQQLNQRSVARRAQVVRELREKKGINSSESMSSIPFLAVTDT